MKHLLTAIGIILIVALGAAMAVPHFIDFTQYRQVIEEEIKLLTAHPAKIEGAIKLRILPTPSISMQRLRLGPVDAQGFPMFEAERVFGALAPTSLLRGEFKITEANIDAPIVRIGKNGLEPLLQANTPSRSEPAPAVSIDRLTVRDGTAIIERKDREALAISSIGGEIEAGSLLGPAKGNGSFAIDGELRHIRFATGKIENGKTRIKALIEDPQLALRFDVDGLAAVGNDASERFDGTIQLVGNTALGEKERVHLPLKLNAKAKVSGPLLMLDELSIVLGQDGQPLTLTGNGRVNLQARPEYDLTLVAKSYDFDRPGPDGKTQRAVPSDLIRDITALLPQTKGAAAPGIDGRIELSAGALIIGGQTVVAPHAIVSHNADGIRIMRLDGELPGQSRISFIHDPVKAGMLSGRLTIDTRDPERLNGWFSGIARSTTAAAGTTLEAELTSVRDGIQIDSLGIQRGDTLIAGTGRYLLRAAGVRPSPQLTLKLTTEKLNVGDMPAFLLASDRREEKPDLDFDIDLAAQKLSIDGRETGRLIAKVRRDGSITSVERIEVGGLDGASLIASGTLGGGSRRVTLKVDAEKAESIASILQHALPSVLTDGLRLRAAALSPALLVAVLSNEEAEDHYAIEADGTLGGTEIKASGKLQAKADIYVDLEIKGSNVDSGRLAQQLSGTQRKLASNLAASGAFVMRGNPRASMDLSLKGSLFGADVNVGGKIKLFQPIVPFEGSLTASSADIYPVLSALAIDPQFLGHVGARVTAKVESNLQKITLADMKAQFGTVPVVGEIAFKIASGGQVAGQLKLPDVDLRPALALVFGPSAAFMTTTGWSTAAFGRAMPPPLSGDLWIEAERGRLDGGTALEQPRGVVRFGEGLIAFEHASMRLGSARVSGELILRRGGNSVLASSQIAFTDVDAEKLKLALRGVAAGELQLSATGDTPAKLAQSLAGSGQLRVAGLTIPAHNPQAVPNLLSASQIGGVNADAAGLTRRINAEFDKAPLIVGEAKFPIVVIDGVARIGSATVKTGDTAHDLSGAYDASRMTADLRIASSMPDPPESWRGGTPLAIVQWRGPILSLQRSVSVEPLVNGFLAMALQRDADIREVQEQDLRERAYFNRRLKAMEWEKRRVEDAKLEAQRAEQARIAEEDRVRRQKAAEEAARRAQQDEAARQQRLAAEEAQRQPRVLTPPLVTPPLDLRPPPQ